MYTIPGMPAIRSAPIPVLASLALAGAALLLWGIFRSAPAPSDAALCAPAYRIPINEATIALLETLPGVGPTRARAIVEARKRFGRFRNLEDLGRIPGLQGRVLEGMASRIRFDDPP